MEYMGLVRLEKSFRKINKPKINGRMVNYADAATSVFFVSIKA